ncbi:MAG: hypothetical protein JXA01_00035 [Dehalococcoidia bacterium]|nr:hypothetical protein [Dehalococcoidia bacterium]
MDLIRMQCKLKQEEQNVKIIMDGMVAGELIYSLQKGHQALNPETVRCENNNSVIAGFSGGEIRDEIQVNENLIKVVRRWTILEPGKWQLKFGYVPDAYLTQWIVPAVMYQNNSMGTGRFPRGGMEKGWSFREDRIPVPSCSIVHNGNDWQAVFASPAENENELSSVRTYLIDSHPAFEIEVPYCEEPFTYTEKGILLGGLSSKTQKLFEIKKAPVEYQRTFYIMSGKCMHTSELFISLASAALNELGNETGSSDIHDWSQIASLKFRHLKYLLIDNARLTAIKMGKGNGLFQSFYEYTAGSFLVKGLEAATIFAKASREVANKQYMDIAERIGAFFLEGALPNGMHRDCYSLKNGEWGGYMGVGTPENLQKGANARCNGEAMKSYLKLYQILKISGINREQFIDVAKSNAGFYIEHQLKGADEGSFGRWWNTDGSPMNTLGTNGAYIVSLLVELEKIEGKSKEINNALEKAGRYYSSLIDKNGFYADTLDADCVDKEAGCALLRAFLDLYERSHDESYLNYARLSAGFVLSWMFTYNVKFNPHFPLGRRNFKTAGMTSVSVAHHHLDFYGLSIAYDYLRLWEATKDNFWKRCALLMIESCGQLISSEQDRLGRSPDFIGWQPEQINQTNWDYKHRILGTKGRFHTCVAWVVVLTLGAMLDIRERYPEVLNFKLAE